MPQGTIESIHIATKSGAPIMTVPSIRAVPGKGLEGDRNFDDDNPKAAVTLIEIEAIEALARDYKTELAPAESRRNIVTRGIALNHLVGVEFSVGGVRMRGTELCEPCNYLASKTTQRVLPGLIHRGGIRAEILSEGAIHVGDTIQP